MFVPGPLFDHIERLARLGSYRWAVGQEPEWSPGLFRVLGYEPGEVTPGAEAFFARVHPDDVANLRAVHERVVRGTGDIVGAPYRIILPGGEVRVLRTRAGYVVEDGGARVMVGTIADVTEEQRSKRAVEEAALLLDDIGALTGVGTFVFEPGLDRVVRSATFRKLIGVEDVASRPQFERAHPDDLARGLAWLQAALAGEEVEPLQYRVQHPDGSVRHLEARARVLKGEPSGPRLVGTVIDATERILLEERRHELGKLEAIGTLAAGVAHDFNNYLTVVAGQLEVARAGGAPAAAIDAATLAVQQCAQLTRQLLAFSRRQPSDARVLDLGGLLEQALASARAALGAGVSVVLEPHAAPLFVRGDPAQLDSVLANLAMNARDAMPDGGTLTVSVAVVDVSGERSHEGVADGRYACIRVRDTGRGIHPDVLPRIFEPYFTTKPPGHGSGLGLASVYGTVRQHGGFIDVLSGADGTAFTVYLPLLDAAGVGPAPAASAASLEGLSVLIVDDVASVRELAAMFLRAEGVRALTCGSGAAALALLETERVDVILTDVIMPALTGLELARAVRAREDAPDVIFMTGYADPKELDLVPTPIVKKPFDAASLRAALAQWRAARRAT